MNTLRYDYLLRKLATILALAIFTLCLIAAITGVLISFYYSPTAATAYSSIEYIDNQVANGWLVRSLHNTAGNALIVISLLQIIIMFLGRHMIGSWIVSWVSGIFLTLSAIGLGWTAMNLEWSQLGYWRFKIELSIIESIPLIGQALRQFLLGGESIGTITLQHLFTIHSYLLSAVALGLSTIHLVSSLLQSQPDQELPLDPRINNPVQNPR
jgi:cytochrome b6